MMILCQTPWRDSGEVTVPHVVAEVEIHPKFTTVSRPRLAMSTQARLQFRSLHILLDASELIRQYCPKRRGEVVVKFAERLIFSLHTESKSIARSRDPVWRCAVKPELHPSLGIHLLIPPSLQDNIMPNAVARRS